MKVLVTGGTGYVGSRLRESLRAAGHDVRLLVRRGSEHKVTEPDAYEITQGDIFNTNACLRACDGVDGVVNLVGIIREQRSRGVTFDQYHRVAAGNILDAARRMGVERFIHMSALGVRKDARSAYHRTKYAGERLVRESPLRWTIFRPSLIFGAGCAFTEQIMALVRKPLVPLVGGGRTLFQPVSLDDTSACVTKALAMPETQNQTYELGGPDRLSLSKIVHEVADAIGKPIKTMNVPMWSARPPVKIMERFDSFPVTSDQLRMLTEDNVCEIDHYVKTFHLEPKSFLRALPGLV
ncbi:MAG: complex I NDUFA9 subunit family protein [Candidatus Krumholzibacteriia bacterium]